MKDEMNEKGMTNDEIARQATGWLVNPMEIDYSGKSQTPEYDAYASRADGMRAKVKQLLDAKDNKYLDMPNGTLEELCKKAEELRKENDLLNEELEDKSEIVGKEAIIADLRSSLDKAREALKIIRRESKHLSNLESIERFVRIHKASDEVLKELDPAHFNSKDSV